ncbi:MAG TPA: hypothetical protein P5518_05630 [Candidatus Cloacimonas sp.]|nr:DUF4878 domain-containing protein [Candidatus Cloacimonas sp.]MDD2250183.1 hypothetical protein [Candidatus Cloacimonadota bacterium]MCK9158260.1 hypothetical protein [Candidatus Cloacimonas sp.]MDD3734092.1 hypothetical protein [Candidatus Cloacimonadota bacterium]MDD4676950.1 hypothetical protein [Candidatus Cloacimonadota bacterium]
MKKLLIAISALALIFVLVGCAKGPESVAQKFIDAWENQDMNSMEKLSTPESKDMLGMFTMFKVKDATVGETKISGDSAIVNISYTTEEGNKDEFDMNMVKKDGKWLVDIKGK